MAAITEAITAFFDSAACLILRCASSGAGIANLTVCLLPLRGVDILEPERMDIFPGIAPVNPFCAGTFDRRFIMQYIHSDSPFGLDVNALPMLRQRQSTGFFIAGAAAPSIFQKGIADTPGRLA